MTFWEMFVDTFTVLLYLVWFFGTIAGLIWSVWSLFEQGHNKANIIGLCVSVLSGVAFIAQLRVLASNLTPQL